MSEHSMITRSKKANNGGGPLQSTLSNEIDPGDDIDEHGNIKGLIDYECDEEYDKDMLDKEIKKLRGGTTPISKLKIQKKKKLKKKNSNNLADTDLSILLIESNTELGGRIKTIEKDKCIFEAGAARFHSSHTKLLSLITELGLKKKIMPLPEGMDHILRSKKKDFPYNSQHNLNLTDLLKESLAKKKTIQKRRINQYNLFSISCKNI